MPADPTDHDLTTLVDAARGGDQDAFTALVARFEPVVIGAAIRVTRDLEDARDVAQQTWMILLRRIDCIRSPQLLAAWLATTSRREAVRLVRRRAPTVTLDEHRLATLVDAADGPEVAVERRETVELVRAALRRLPPPEVDLLVHLVGHARPYAEVSAQLGRPIGSLGPLRARYLRQLSEALEAVGA